MKKLNSKQLRIIPNIEADDIAKSLVRKPLYFILENVYDTYNIGGIFRLADALAVSKIYLCGEMETPPNHKIQKASVGTHKIVPWEYKLSALEAIRELKEFSISNSQFSKSSEFINHKSKKTLHVTRSALHVCAVEQSKSSIPYTEADYALPLALILGNETFGLSKETLSLVDQIVEIPMWGINKSLNVIVSAAIVSYYAVGVKRITFNV